MQPGQPKSVPSSLVSDEECEKIAEEMCRKFGDETGVDAFDLPEVVREILTAERERAKRFRASVLLEAAQLVKEAKAVA